MTIELLSIFSILIGGYLLAILFGIRGWGAPAIGFIVGTAFMIILGSAQVVTMLTTNPLSTLSLTMLIPIGLWAWLCLKRRVEMPFRILPVILFLAGITFTVFGLHTANLLNLMPDSFQYAQIGSLLESGNIDAAQPGLLLARLLGVPLMHAPANLANEFFLRSVTPLLSLSTVLSLAWFCRQGLQEKRKNGWMIYAFPSAAALLLATNQFFVYNAFYVNGHLLYSALLLLIAGSSWLYAINSDVPKNALLLIILFAIPAIIVTRPEAGLHLLIILLPVFISERFSPRHKGFILAALSISIIVWNGFLLLKFLSAGQSAPIAVSAMLCIGIASIVAIPLLFLRLFDKISPRILPSTEIGLWAGLLIATLIHPEMFYRSVSATIHNILLGAGLWGYALIILGILFLGTLFFSKAPERVFLRFPVTTFLPFGLLLAFLRGESYRIGPFDSFNRMFLHIVPLVILFIVSSAVTGKWGLSHYKSEEIKTGQ